VKQVGKSMPIDSSFFDQVRAILAMNSLVLDIQTRFHHDCDKFKFSDSTLYLLLAEFSYIIQSMHLFNKHQTMPNYGYHQKIGMLNLSKIDNYWSLSYNFGVSNNNKISFTRKSGIVTKQLQTNLIRNEFYFKLATKY